MLTLLEFIDKLSPIAEDAKDELIKRIQTQNYKKGELIHAMGKVSRHLFFIDSGLVKHFYYHHESYYVLRFFEEKEFFLATDSFFNNQPAEYSTMALEDTCIYYLAYTDFEYLCQKYHSFESFARKLVSIVAYTAISNLKNLLYLDASERYEVFLQKYGHLQQRISLGDTAGFLGISQVSLSRIRAKK